MISPLRGIPLYIFVLSACLILLIVFGFWLRTTSGLCWTLHNGIQKSRAGAAYELSDSADPRAVRCLLAALGEDDPATRTYALYALSAHNSINLLLEAAAAAHPLARPEIFRLLVGHADQDPARLLPFFTASLSDPQPAVRRNSVEGLGRLAGFAESSLPVLLPLIGDPDEGVRNATARTLEHIGGAAALRDAMKDQTPGAQLALIRFLNSHVDEKPSLIELLLPEINRATRNVFDPEVSRLAMNILIRRANAAKKP